MSEPDEASSAPTSDDDPHFAQRIQAEIAAEAERRRREDPELARIEREIERTWADVAPPGAVGPTEELLLDRIDRLSMVDVDAPVGTRPGIRQVKGAIRKGTYWYLRYMSDQLNALHNVQARLLRRMDDRLAKIETAVGLDRTVDELVDPAAAPGAGVGELIVERLSGIDGPVLVVSCGSGGCVGALTAAGVAAYGVDGDPEAVLSGIDNGLDLRVADPSDAVAAIDDRALGGIVIGGSLQRVGVAEVIELAGLALAACGPGGFVAVAVEAHDRRSLVETELLAGRAVSPQTWAHVLETGGGAIELAEVDDDGLAAVVIARLP